MTLEQFNEKVRVHLLAQFPAKTNLSIQAVDSTTNVAVQIADWICGALARYYEGKKFGQEFYKILEGNIGKSKELFSEIGH